MDGEDTSRGRLFAGLFSEEGRARVHFGDDADAVGGSSRRRIRSTGESRGGLGLRVNCDVIVISA